MKRFLRFIGWKNYSNKWQWDEVIVDMVVLAVVILVAFVGWGLV